MPDCGKCGKDYDGDNHQFYFICLKCCTNITCNHCNVYMCHLNKSGENHICELQRFCKLQFCKKFEHLNGYCESHCSEKSCNHCWNYNCNLEKHIGNICKMHCISKECDHCVSQYCNNLKTDDKFCDNCKICTSTRDCKRLKECEFACALHCSNQKCMIHCEDSYCDAPPNELCKHFCESHCKINHKVNESGEFENSEYLHHCINFNCGEKQDCEFALCATHCSKKKCKKHCRDYNCANLNICKGSFYCQEHCTNKLCKNHCVVNNCKKSKTCGDTCAKHCTDKLPHKLNHCTRSDCENLKTDDSDFCSDIKCSKCRKCNNFEVKCGLLCDKCCTSDYFCRKTHCKDFGCNNQQHKNSKCMKCCHKENESDSESDAYSHRTWGTESEANYQRDRFHCTDHCGVKTCDLEICARKMCKSHCSEINHGHCIVFDCGEDFFDDDFCEFHLN